MHFASFKQADNQLGYSHSNYIPPLLAFTNIHPIFTADKLISILIVAIWTLIFFYI